MTDEFDYMRQNPDIKEYARKINHMKLTIKRLEEESASEQSSFADRVVDTRYPSEREGKSASSGSRSVVSSASENVIHTDVPEEISGIDSKTTPVGADEILIEDSEDDYNKKSSTIAEIEAILDHTNIQSIGTNTHAEIDTHIADESNPHSVTHTQVSGASSHAHSSLTAIGASDHHTKTTDASELTAGVLVDARVQESNVTQHEAALSITESQISDLDHLTEAEISVENIGDVTITDIGSGELLKWSGTAWVNNTLAEAGIAEDDHTHVEDDITDLQSYLLNIESESIDDLSDVDITTDAIQTDEILKWDGTKLVPTTVASEQSDLALDDLTDVVIDTPADKHVAVYEGVTNNRWENRALVEDDISDLQSYLLNITGESIGDLSDVDLTGISTDDFLKWDGSKFVADAGTGSYSDSDVESYLEGLGFDPSEMKFTAGSDYKEIKIRTDQDDIPSGRASYIATTGGDGSGIWSNFGSLVISPRNESTSSSKIFFLTSQSTRMIIDNDGTIYFGEDSGDDRSWVGDGVYRTNRAPGGGTRAVFAAYTDGAQRWDLAVYGNSDFQVKVGGTEALRLNTSELDISGDFKIDGTTRISSGGVGTFASVTSSGTVSVGSSTPMEVQTTGINRDADWTLKRDGVTVFTFFDNRTDSHDAFAPDSDNAHTLGVNTRGWSEVYHHGLTNLSSATLKEEINYVETDIAPLIKLLKPATFKRKKRAHKEFGFILEDIHDLISEYPALRYILTYNDDDTEHENPLGLKINAFAPVIIKTLQEIIERLEILEGVK